MPGRFLNSEETPHDGLKQPEERQPLKKETEMPKLKTKSGAKKRFKFTATGKVKAGVAGKRHRLISHNSKYIRQNRGTSVMADADAKKIKSYMPYA
jgi:large subunit ribosomal protein L35